MMIVPLKRLLNPILAPYPIDSFFFNLVHALEQLVAGIYLCFFFNSNSFTATNDYFKNPIFNFSISQDLIDSISKIGPPFDTNPYAYAIAFCLIKCVGGLFLILGFFTRPVALLILLLMLLMLINNYAFEEFNLACNIIMISIAILSIIFGGGRFSVDFLLTRKSKIV